MNTIINGYYTAEVANASSSIDAAAFGGTAGQGATITPNNVAKLFTLGQKKFGRMNVFNYKSGESPFFANITPDIYQTLVEYLGDRQSVLGDKLSEHGHAGRFNIFDLYVHNSGYWTGELVMDTNPTDGDTMAIQIADQTITITFRATLGVLPGSVHIASTVDITRANLAEFLNAPGTTEAEDTDTGYVALSTDHQAVLYGSTWTNANSTDKLTVTWRGAGAPIVSETFTTATNIFSVGKLISHNMFGKKGAVDFVIQKQPNHSNKRDGEAPR